MYKRQPENNPLDWHIRCFGDLLEGPLRNGISPSRKGAVQGRVLTLSAITGMSFDPSFVKDGLFNDEIAETDQVAAGEFYICRGNGNPQLVGKGYFAPQSMKGVAFPDTMIAAKPDRAVVFPEYVESVWATCFVRDQIAKSARTTNGTHKINQTATEEIRLPVPPIDLQERFASLVSKLRIAKDRFIEATHQSETNFAALSQRAFRGEL